MTDQEKRRPRRNIQADIVSLCETIDPAGSKLSVSQRLYPTPGGIVIHAANREVRCASWVEALAVLQGMEAVLGG